MNMKFEMPLGKPYKHPFAWSLQIPTPVEPGSAPIISLYEYGESAYTAIPVFREAISETELIPSLKEVSNLATQANFYLADEDSSPAFQTLSKKCFYTLFGIYIRSGCGHYDEGFFRLYHKEQDNIFLKKFCADRILKYFQSGMMTQDEYEATDFYKESVEKARKIVGNRLIDALSHKLYPELPDQRYKQCVDFTADMLDVIAPNVNLEAETKK